MRAFLRKTIAFAVGMLATVSLLAQAQITTRREKLKDFSTRITKVVLTGDPFYDEAIKEGISNHWSLSPCEFCTRQEFEALKTNTNLFFLVVAEDRYSEEDEPGIKTLSLVRGGAEAADGVGKMLEVVSFPLCSAEDPSGREFVLLPAAITIIQKHTSIQLDTEMKAYTSLGIYNKNTSKLWNKRILLCKEEMSPQVTRDLVESLDEDIVIEEVDIVDEAFAGASFNTVVGFVVAPSSPSEGSLCYKMLIGADDHNLYYFKKHKISGRDGAGFLERDLKSLMGTRKRKR